MPVPKSIELPRKKIPIVIIGAGGIVRDAHLPAYEKAGFEVLGIYDQNPEASANLVKNSIAQVQYLSLEEVTCHENVIFDIATPPQIFSKILKQLPRGSGVLMQKPMGSNIEEALEIRDICRERNLKAAVNFQLRYSPLILQVRELLESDTIGEVQDVEFRINVHTPWELFPFLKDLDRVEIQVHSIHYLDLIRSFIGDPESVYACSLSHPEFKNLAQTRSTIILNYGDKVRCSIMTNHHHDYGATGQLSMMKIEGSKGYIEAKIGLLLNYPKGERDDLYCYSKENGGANFPVEGEWFPDAFVGTMSAVQRYVLGETDKFPIGVEDALKTMSLVESCYASSQSKGTPVKAL